MLYYYCALHLWDKVAECPNILHEMLANTRPSWPCCTNSPSITACDLEKLIEKVQNGQNLEYKKKTIALAIYWVLDSMNEYTPPPLVKVWQNHFLVLAISSFLIGSTNLGFSILLNFQSYSFPSSSFLSLSHIRIYLWFVRKGPTTFHSSELPADRDEFLFCIIHTQALMASQSLCTCFMSDISSTVKT